MSIPQNIIDDIREKADIVGVIADYVPLKKRGVNYTGCCPFHQEKTPSFSVSPQKNIWHCFGCGEGGNSYTFLMKINSCSFVEAVENLAERVGITIPTDPKTKAAQEKYNFLYKQMGKEKESYTKLLWSAQGSTALKYIHDRDVSDDVINKYQLGYAESGRFRGRLIFPINDIKGRCLGFGGRVLDNDLKTAKYINSAESPIYVKGNHLFGLDVAKMAIQKQDMAIVVEGYLDAIACYQAGFENVVAVLGTALTQSQSRLLSRFTKNIVLAFDSDSAGQKATVRSLELLAAQDLEISVAKMIGKDPDETIKAYGVDSFRQSVCEPIPRLQYQIDLVCLALDINSPEGKSLAVKEVKKILDKEDAILRGEYEKYLATKLGVDYFALQDKINRTGSTPNHQDEHNSQQTKLYKIAAGLLQRVLTDPTLRESLFTHFTPSDFADDQLISLAEKLQNSTLELQEFIESIENVELRNKAAEVSFIEYPGEFQDLIKAMKRHKKDQLLSLIKDRMQVAEKNSDQDKLNELQQEYLVLKRG